MIDYDEQLTPQQNLIRLLQQQNQTEGISNGLVRNPIAPDFPVPPFEILVAKAVINAAQQAANAGNGAGGAPVTSDQPITSTDATGTEYARIRHDGTDAFLEALGGQLRLAPGASQYIIQQDGIGLLPQSEAMVLGTITAVGGTNLRWNGYFTDLQVDGDFVAVPAASATPAVNGQMVFQLTSNTALAIKVRGSDGVVRTGTITLS